MQSHSAFPDDDGMFIWAHPFDIHFNAGCIHGWPKFMLKVWRLDDFGKLDNSKYKPITPHSLIRSISITKRKWVI
jgi:hypothetical protein